MQQAAGLTIYWCEICLAVSGSEICIAVPEINEETWQKFRARQKIEKLARRGEQVSNDGSPEIPCENEGVVASQVARFQWQCRL